MGKGRRWAIHREMKRAITNLDKYLLHCQTSLTIIAEDNLELASSIEALASFCIIFQEKTQAFIDNT